MQVVIRPNLSEIAFEDAVRRLNKLIETHIPPLSENDVQKARYDDIRELVDSLRDTDDIDTCACTWLEV